MNEMSRVLILAVLATALPSCSTSTPPGRSSPPVLVAAPQPGLPPVPTPAQLEAAACTGVLWIGIRNGQAQPCGQISYPNGWTGEDLFEHQSDEHSENLAKFCLIRWDGAQYPPPDLLDDFAGNWQQHFDELDADCLAVAPAATADYKEWRASETALHAGMSPTSAAGSGGVRLAFLDTGETSDEPYRDRPSPASDPCADGQPCSPHGFSLVTLGRRLLCGGPRTIARCAGVELTSQLALPRLPEDGARAELRPAGGLVGYLSDVARAINREVHAWEAWRPTATPPAGLVMSLSFGWEAYFGGPFERPDEMPARAHAVYAALEHAVCRGALVVAAAGNFQGPPNFGEDAPTSSDAAVLPGAWETKPAPSAIGRHACLEIDRVAYAPLVHSVGGLDADDRPLPNTRPLAMPRLAAYSDHVVVRAYGEPGMATSSLTGSSVGTAVVASAAAAVWSRVPTLSPAAVMQAVYDAGSGVAADVTGAPRLSDYYLVGLGSGPPPVHGIRVRDVVNAAVSPSPVLPPWICGTACAAAPPVDDWDSLPQEAIKSAPAGGTGCHNELAGEGACPHWTYPNIDATPWGGPQPGSNPCTNCNHTPPHSPASVYIELDPEFRLGGEKVSSVADVVLIIGADITDQDWDSNTSGTEQSYRYPVPGISFIAGSNRKVVCIDPSVLDALPDEYGMLLSMTVTTSTGLRSLIAPVLALPADVPGPCTSP
jgi:hypothetical protein